MPESPATRNIRATDPRRDRLGAKLPDCRLHGPEWEGEGAPFLSDVSHQWRYMPFTKEQWDAAVFQAPESLIQVSLQRIVRARWVPFRSAS